MKAGQHIKIGKCVLNKIGDARVKEYKINKLAYLIGNIAPDLNCIYPAHRLVCTEKRFIRKVKFIDKSRINILKSFQLGVVTHYLCDYFCYPHVMEFIGLTHKEYEKNLYKLYRLHVQEIEEGNEGIIESWIKNKKVVIENVIEDSNINIDKHCEFIIRQIRLMNNDYKNEIKQYNNKVWAFDYEQMSRDIRYTLIIVENIINLVLEPFNCLAVV